MNIYDILGVSKEQSLRSRQHVGHALTGLGVRALFLICPGRKKTNPTWHVTQFSHVFLLTCNMILTNHNLADVAGHVNMIVSFITACSKVYVALADFFVGKPLLYDGL